MHGLRDSQPEEVPDIFLRGMPMTLETAVAYFRIKNYAGWPGATIALHPWDTWEKLGDRLSLRFGLHIWHPAHWEGPDACFTPKENPMPISERTPLLTLCSQLHEVGLWLSLNDDNALIMGPKALITKHPELLQAVRDHKAELVRLLEDCLVHDLYGTQTDDPRFVREACPECHQPCLVVDAPRRLGVHRLPGGAAMCPGSDRAQHATAATIMEAFIPDRCVVRPQGMLTWYALRGALEAWCLERSFFLPPRPFVLAWLDAHYTRHGETDRPIWQGLVLTLEEWGLDEPPKEDLPKVPPGKQKLVLTA